MRIRLDITYDGREFFGWQKQGAKRTVAGVIEEGIKKVLGFSVVLKGAGRTDRGVHALCQTAHFDIASSHIPVESLAAALNMELPPDVKILQSRQVGEDFHARLSAAGKIYQYKIYASNIHPPLLRHTHWIVAPSFDMQKAQECLDFFVGTHDFTSFCYADKGEKSKERTITRSKIFSSGENEYIIEIEGKSFLHNMVRIMAGTVVKIACSKKFYPQEIQNILQAKDRQKAASTAPACALYLKEVFY